MNNGFAGGLRQPVARLRRDASGSVLTMFAVMLTVLAGFVALAIDVGLWYTTQQRMQNAADAAALAGALELAKPGHTTGQVVAAAEQGAASNRFDPADGATVAVAIAPDDRSVAVEISAIGPMALASLFLSEPVSIAARAVAGLRRGDPICLLTLDPSSPNALVVDSKAQISAPDCAIHVNSTSSGGLYIDANGSIDATSICVTAGGYNQQGHSSLSPTPETGCPAKADPLADLAPPPSGGCTYNKTRLNATTTTLNPGIYCDGLEINKSNVTFNPGIYVIKGDRFYVDGDSTVAGTGVSFYLEGASAIVEFDADSVIDLSAPATGSMAGVLFFHDRNVAGLPVHQIDADSDNKRLQGVLYFPAAKLLVDNKGTLGGSSPCTVVIARRFEADATGMVKLAADPDTCPTAYAGSSAVRLIE